MELDFSELVRELGLSEDNLGKFYESIVSNRAKKMRVGNQFRPAFAGFCPETTLSLRNSSGLLHFAAHLGRFQNSQKNPRRYCLHCL